MKEDVAPGRDIGYLVQVPWMTENNLLDIKDKLKVRGACRGPTYLKSWPFERAEGFKSPWLHRALETAVASLQYWK